MAGVVDIVAAGAVVTAAMVAVGRKRVERRFSTPVEVDGENTIAIERRAMRRAARIVLVPGAGAGVVGPVLASF